MKRRHEQGLLRLALTSLVFYAVDMGCAVAGFVLGFGLTIKNWWAVLGFMVLSRWITWVCRGAWDIERTKDGQKP